MQQRVRSAHQHLQKHHVQYWQIRNAIKEELMHLSHSNHDMVQVIKHLLETGHGTRLANAIYLYDTKQKAAHSTDPSGLSAYYPPLPDALPPVYDCRTQWDLRLRHELHAVAHKQKRPLLQLRSVQSESDEYIIRFVYTSEDLLETMMTGIVNPNHVHTSYTWTCLRVYLEIRNLSILRTRYAELRPEIRHVGVDEQVEGMEWFRTERLKKGTELLSQGYIPAMRQFAKTGIPASLRPRMWSMMMNVNVGQQELHYFESLLSQVQQYDMITDDLTRFDVQDACDHEYVR